MFSLCANLPVFPIGLILKWLGSLFDGTGEMEGLLAAPQLAPRCGTLFLAATAVLKERWWTVRLGRCRQTRGICSDPKGLKRTYQFGSSFHLFLHVLDREAKQVVKLWRVGAKDPRRVELETNETVVEQMRYKTLFYAFPLWNCYNKRYIYLRLIIATYKAPCKSIHNPWAFSHLPCCHHKLQCILVRFCGFE